VLERIAQTIARYRMFEAGQKVGVAVSGGADSVCLLHALRELAPRWDLRLHVLHVNHRLRGAESDEDAQFVRDQAAQFGLPFTIHEANLATTPDNLEQAAREIRMAFFNETIARGAVARVATGHTRSDQAETVLFRFLRGAGTAGLAGIRPVTAEGIVRPLLEIDRSQVMAFVKQQSLPWRDDSTNRSLEFARNRIRHELLPILEREWNPAFLRTLAQTADWALAEECYWAAEMDRLAQRFLTSEGKYILLNTKSLSGIPEAVARRLVRRGMELVKGNLRGIEFVHVAEVLALARNSHGHGRLQAAGLDIMRSFEWLRFGRPTGHELGARDYRLPAPVPGVIPVPGESVEICLELVEKPQSSDGPDALIYNGLMARVNWRLVAGPLELRNWRPGDQYQPQGTSGTKKIKTLFQKFRVPLWKRRHWPVLTSGPSIVWARRFGPASVFAAGPDSREVLTIREMRIAPEQTDVYRSDKAGTEG
jgi:tRNA(Ile)-lysidine synthase